MTTIDAVTGRPGVRSTTLSPNRAPGGFQVPEDSTQDPPGVAAPNAVGHVSLDVMLAAEALDQDAHRNARARRQGQAMLRGLGLLQRTLLGGGDPRTALVELAQLISDLPVPADPKLAAVLDSITLRARVELARHGG
jgi:hypothetical protein